MEMFGFRNFAYRCAFDALYFSGLAGLLRPFVAGVGSILTLHHVKPPRGGRFQPNQFLEITPDFLDRIVRRMKQNNIDIVSLDEAARRLTERDFKRHFVVITLDDGYRDNKLFAYPVFKKHNVPFTIFVTTSFAEGRGLLWWEALESIVAANDEIVLPMDGQVHKLACRTIAEKHDVYLKLRGWLMVRPSKSEMLDFMGELATRYRVDMDAICASLCMNWDELVDLATDPLVTIGAHTANHIMLGRASDAVVRAELKTSRDILEEKFDREIRHLAYPFGDAQAAGQREFTIAAELGYKTAVTTRPSMLFPENRNHLVALPRITVSGEFQRERHFAVLVSGAATALWNGFHGLQAG